MKYLILLIIPAIVLSIGIFIKYQSGPYWLGMNSDPEYVYLLNSLNLIQLKPPGFYSHPGIPLQIIGAILIPLAHLTNFKTDIIWDVLIRPEYYLNVLNRLILCAIFISLYMTGFLAYKLTNNLTLGLIIEITPFLSLISLLVMHRVSPEPLLLIGGVWFSYFILYLYYKLPIVNVKIVFLWSIVSSFLIATKITSFPILLIPIIILNSKNKLQYILYTIIFFIVFTFPIVPNYPKLFNYLYQIFIHAGNLGQGPSTIVSINLLFNNLIIIYIHEIYLCLTVIVIAVILLFQLINRRRKEVSQFLTSLLCFYLLQSLIVAKHFNFRYLVPSLSLLGVTSIIIFLETKKLHLVDNKILVLICSSFLTLIVFLNVVQVIPYMFKWNENRIESAQIDNLIIRKYSNSLLVSYYGASNIAYALEFGNNYSNRNYTQLLNSLYPGRYFYNMGLPQSVYTGDKFIALPKDSSIVFRGVPFFEEYKAYKPPLQLNDVYHGITETLYVYTNFN